MRGGDAHEAASRLASSTQAFLALLDGISDRQWLLRPHGEAWSIAETVEHVWLTDRAIAARLAQLAAAPIAPETVRFDDAKIGEAMFLTAGPAPPGLAEPTGRFATRAEGASALAAACDAIAEAAVAGGIDLRAYGLPHPVFGLFDGVQWIRFAAAHTDNHVPQLRALRRLLSNEAGC